MRKLDRYVLREVLPMFIGGTAAALLLLTTLKFFQGADSLARSRMPVTEVLQDIGWRIPSVLVMTLPVATALAASLATNRLARDNEIVSLRSSGVSLARICAPLFAFALATSAINVAVAEWLVPKAFVAQRGGSRTQTNNAFESGATLRSGKVLIKYDTAQKLTEERRRLSHVMVIQRVPTVAIWLAPFANYDRGKFRLEDAVLHNYDASGKLVEEKKIAFLELNLPIDFSGSTSGLSSDSLDNLSFVELTKRAEGARIRGEYGNALELEVGRWCKLSLAAMCFSLGLLAPPLALKFSQAGGFTGVLLSVIMVFVAWNTWLLLKYVGQAGYLPPLVAAWSTNAIFGLIGLWLLRSAE